MRRSPLALLLALVATIALLAGCGASGGNDEGADSPTTEAPADGDATTTTAGEGDDDGGDEGGGGGGGASNLTDADLAALLPTESDIGNGYLLVDGDDDEVDDLDDGSDETDEALEEACPALAQLDLEDDTDDGPSVTFQVPADEREVEVSLTRDAGVFAEDQLDELIDAFNECGTIDVTDDASGMGISMELSAQRTDAYGDFGMLLNMSAEFNFFGMPIAVEFRGIAFGRDGLGVFVSASSGMDEGDGFDLTPVPPDEDVLVAMARLMDERIAAL